MKSVDEVRMSGVEACDSLRFDIQTHRHRVAPTTESARVVQKGLGHFQGGRSKVTGFDSLKDRTGGRGQTSAFADEPEPNCPALKQVKEIENGKTPEKGEGFLFRDSTDPAAKESLFLERFTCFQQGRSCA
jgi:hypothetical protein